MTTAQRTPGTPVVRFDEELERAATMGGELAARLGAFLEQTRAAFVPIAERIGRDLERLADAWHIVMWRSTLSGSRQHRRRCRRCNPRGNPRPLPIDGRAYARRRRARVRRGRR